jgi:hypothetical protein
MKHINNPIKDINAMLGPAEGELRVRLVAKGSQDCWGHFAPHEAIKIIRENPRIEFEATEKWLLS